MGRADTRDRAGETGTLARFLAGASLDGVPDGVVDHAKRMMLDTLGVSLAAADAEAARIAREVSLGAGGGPARVLGDGSTDRIKEVAFVNGVMSHALDFDDVHHGMGGHPSAPVLSAALPVAEAIDASGRELLRAFLLGTEVEIALAEVMNPGHYERGWHPTAVLGHLGTAAAAGALYGLDADGFRRALGVAASQAGGIKGNFGTMTKPYHVGRAARAGVEAARLADAGFTASRDVLELDFGGFCDLFEGDPPHDFADHLDRLGDPWGILDPPVAFKPYPCCGSTHAAIDCALALHDGIDPDGVERVDVTVHPRRLPHTDRPEPADGLDGKFSVQYVVGTALRRGDVWLDDFADAAVTRPEAVALTERVRTRPDPDMPEWGARVEVQTGDGTVEHEVAAPLGSAERPMGDDGIEGKYRRCAAGLPEEKADRSVELVGRLETLESAVELVDSVT